MVNHMEYTFFSTWKLPPNFENCQRWFDFYESKIKYVTCSGETGNKLGSDKFLIK